MTSNPHPPQREIIVAASLVVSQDKVDNVDNVVVDSLDDKPGGCCVGLSWTSATVPSLHRHDVN